MFSDNLRQVKQEIQDSCALVSRKNQVRLVAVTKSVDLQTTKKVIDNGITDLAENRVDNFLAKKQAFSNFPSISWHFIGNLQRRKVKLVINEIDYFHALDSVKLAQEIQKRATHQIRCFLEVNISQESSKQGVSPKEIIPFLEEIKAFDKIEVIGLMTMAPREASKEELHQVFGELKNLQESIQKMNLSYAPCNELSMGMSNDFPIAIQEGATFVRVGTALFKE